MAPSTFTLADVEKIAQGIYQEELKGLQSSQSANNDAKPQLINPATHLVKLASSHGIERSAPARDFFEGMLDDTFFEGNNMPKEWKPRTCSSAMESIAKILAHEEIIKRLGSERYEEIIKRVDEKRKHYMNDYKRKQRANAKQVSQSAQSDDEEELVGIDGPIENASTKALYSPTRDQDLDQDVIEMDLGLLKSRIGRTSEMLMKYMEHESDEFKRLYLDLIMEELDRISSIIP
jgi:hypothetical protein